MAILEFMSQHSSFSDLCQFIISDLLVAHEPWGACIGNCTASGKMEILGSFGMGEGLITQYESASCLGMPPSSGVYVCGQNVELESSMDESVVVAPLFFTMNSHGPNAVALIDLNSQLVGYVQILFLHPPKSRELIRVLKTIALACRAELIMYRMYSKSYIPNSTQLPVSNGHAPPLFQSEHMKGNATTSENTDLSVRQLEILTCIANGMTNSGIARKIGYSDSTVRQETIAIYRKLGVSDRKEAAQVGQMSGLISKEPVHAI
jgi:DNA-binding NarL/FixJ family response regulator